MGARCAGCVGVLGAMVLGGMVLGPALAAQQPTPPPQIKSGVELVAIDVQVVDGSGKPMAALGPDAFEVTIDGKARKVTSATLVRYANDSLTGSATTPASDDATASTGRIFIMAVDEVTLPTFAPRGITVAAEKFIDKLQPDDLVGLFSYPTGGALLDPTSDKDAIKAAFSKVVGTREGPGRTEFGLSASEVVDITAKDADALNKVAARACTDASDLSCKNRILMEAQSTCAYLESLIGQSVSGLYGLLDAIKEMPGRKMLVLLSGGLATSDRIGGRPDLRTQLSDAGRKVAEANATLYLLHLDNSFFEGFASGNPRMNETLFRDSRFLERGLEMLVGGGCGALLSVNAGTGEAQFERVLRETSAYYVVGVEPTDADRDGKAHPIRVKVKTKGATVRSRTALVIPKKS